jgi:beta-glucuronidase
VWLYSTPRSYIVDVSVAAAFDPQTGAGRVTYGVDAVGDGATSVVLRDADGAVVAESAGPAGDLTVPGARPWSPEDPYLYRLDVVHGGDEYSLPVGIRTVQVEGARLLLNGTPVRLRGFGMHEDSVLHGKGHDDARMVRDFALLKWIGANSFRTSHYPYAEEVLDYADRQGLLVIDEAPAVGLHLSLGHMGDAGARTFGPDAIGEAAAAAHLAAIRELIARDRNHPSVIAWSVANEPDTAEWAARGYFTPLVSEVRKLDTTRPVCFANVATAPPDLDVVTDLFDLVCVNRYYGWYVDTGDLEAAERNLEAELRAWARHGKPILVTEFGADAMPGRHALPPTAWSEEYQAQLIEMSIRVFRRVPEVIGEHVWNFADFLTAQAVHRPGGNHKGVFTRDRQPKAVSWLLRELWRDQPR